MLTSCALLGLCLVVPQDWTNSGGGAANDGFSQTFGPLAADVAWSAGPPSIIGWEPMAANGRVFSVRQTGFPPAGEPNGSPIVAQDLETGLVLWTADLPFAAGDWTTWVGGTSNGALYAARSGNGATAEAPLVALEQDTGAVRWTSAEEIRASGYNGMLFAPDGDPIVAWNTTVRRIDADTGATVWSTPRSCSVTGACGGALSLGGPLGDKLYLVQVVAGGQAVSRFDLATGAFELSGPTMTGFTLQNTPLVAPDGSIVVARTQNNPATDFLYVFEDSGASIQERWNVPTGWTTTSEFAVGRDGSIYAFSADYRLTRFDGVAGAILDQSAVLPTSGYATRLATDLDGRVYCLTGSSPTSLLYGFDDDLDLRWSTPAPSVNVGGPVLAATAAWESAYLIVALKDELRAYRTPKPFTDEGFPFAQSNGVEPALDLFGTLLPGKTIRAVVTDIIPGSTTYLAYGQGTAFLPLGPVTLVPLPSAFIALGAAPASGSLAVQGPWPAAAIAGQPIAFQALVVDLGVPGFLSASNGVSGTGGI